MAIGLKSAEELYVWNKRVLSIGGMWPLEPTFIKFYICYIYFIIHVGLAVADLISVFGDMQLMIANLLETSVQTMFIIKMIVLRHSGTLKSVLRRVEEGTNEKNYRDETEKTLYLAYNLIGKRFFKIAHYVAFFAGVVYYFTPMNDFVLAAQSFTNLENVLFITFNSTAFTYVSIGPNEKSGAIHNETLPYILPFKTHLFFNIEDIRIYTLMYIWQFPIFYYDYCHAMAVCFLCTLVVHVTGEMSILAYRIRRMGAASNLSNTYSHPGMAFQDIVTKHLQIIWNASAIDDIFNLVLLEELLISTILIAFVVYSLISITPSIFDIMFLANYCFALLMLILVYCITGEYLISESANIHQAYYECQWYDMKPTQQKNLIICMIRAKQPLYLTAGKCYIFSLPRFSEILKTAMAYISMLRTVV